MTNVYQPPTGGKTAMGVYVWIALAADGASALGARALSPLYSFAARPLSVENGGAAQHLPAILLVVLLAGLTAAVCAFLRKRKRRRADVRFARMAEHFLTDGRARAAVVARLEGAARLSAARRKSALKTLQLYLESFIGRGEALISLKKDEFGLILLCKDSAALSAKLSILSADVSYLYMAAYPTLALRARIGVCPFDAACSAAQALEIARQGGVGETPGAAGGRIA